MYNIEKKNYGYKLSFGGFMLVDEVKKWVADSRQILAPANGKFGVFVDMRTLKPLPMDAQVFMQEGQQLFQAKGMIRSVVILANVITKIQFQRIGKETGIYEWERYIDIESEPNWEQVGLDWIIKGIDPDS